MISVRTVCRTLIFLFCMMAFVSLPAQDRHPALSSPSDTAGPAEKPAADTSRLHLPASDSSTVVLEKSSKWGFITNLPRDTWSLAKSPFRKQNLVGLSVVAASSALLIWKDQALLDGAMQLGRNIHLDPQTSYKVLVKAGTTKILKVPLNLNTALYQMGEGGTSMALAGGLFLYGKIAHRPREVQTAKDLTEGFLLMGFSTQVLKRISGRQSPFMRTQPGGAWHPFPSFHDYQTNTSNFDAFPSGHLSTLMCTVTILAEDYPEKHWIKPVGYSIIGLVGFAMMNTEVHWAGDYPLALALGYVSGKIVTWHHRARKSRPLPQL